MKTVGTVGIVLGLIALVVAIVLGVMSFGRMLDSAKPFAESSAIRGSGEVTLTEGTDYSFFASGTSPMQCEVTQPDGASAPVRPPMPSANYEFNSVAWRKVFELSASQTGAYAVSCSADDPVIAVPGEGVGLVGNTFGLVGSVLLGFAGAILLVVGIVVRVLGSGKAKRASAPQPWQQPGPPPPYQTR